ncbi:MAG TPA: hypothetical protein VJJ48_00260 [Candidatus Paceibacterota bacterium]
MVATTTRGEWEAQATKLLARAGYQSNGQVKSSKRVSVRAISTPCGGKPGWRRK